MSPARREHGAEPLDTAGRGAAQSGEQAVGVRCAATRSVWFGRPPGFAVIPEVKEGNSRDRHLIRPQLIAMGLPAAALVIGTARLATGLDEPLGTLVDTARGAFDLVVLSVQVEAVRHAGFVPRDRAVETLGS